MSDYSSMATLQNNSQTAGFATAVQRARLVAAKLGSGKRPLEEGPEPSAKKAAPVEQVYQQELSPHSVMSGPPASALASMGGPGIRLPQPPAPSAAGTPNMMPDQGINEYIRVPDKMVGLIIGRGGEQITRLQAESGCKIQMAPDSGGQPDRLCTLTGSREAIQRAKDMVNQIVNHRGRENAPQHPDGQGPPGVVAPPMPRSGPITEEIMLPGPKVGLIIGKSGKTIKQLQEQSGAKMIVIQDGPNTEYEKPLRISGDQAKVEHAKQLVYELLADKEIQGGLRFDEGGFNSDQGNGIPSNATEVLVPKVAVGVVIGRGGDMIKKIQSDTGARVQFHQERDDGPGDKRCYLQGKPHQVEQARQMIEDLISSVNRREQEVRTNRSRGGPGQRNGGGDRPPAEYAQQWHETPEVRVTFTVSNVKCGLIIGRGGEVIKQINAQSGAHCELDRRAQSADRNNRTFYIKGQPEAVEQCKRIIMEKVGMPVNFIHENGNGNGNGGNGGGGNGGSDYYGGGGGPAAAWGYNPHWHQPTMPQQQQQPAQVQINPVTGQPDYSQQWIEYYRSLGLMQEAEAIEQQTKQKELLQLEQQQAEQNMASTSLMQPEEESPKHCGTPTPTNAAQSSGNQQVGQSGPQPDYSAQWAEYYRGIGKVKEAEAIEAQIKLKQAQQAAEQQQQQQQVAAQQQQLQQQQQHQQQQHQQQQHQQQQHQQQQQQVQMQQPGPTPSPVPAQSPSSANNPMMAQYAAQQYSMYAAPGVYPGYAAAYQYAGGGVPTPTTPDHNQQ